jgi:hypothetical protein
LAGAEARLADPVKLAIAMTCVRASIVSRRFRGEFPLRGELNSVRTWLIRGVWQVEYGVFWRTHGAACLSS